MSTYREQFDSAMACNTREMADLWLAAEIERYVNEFGQAEAQARNVILQNLGYMAGYGDDSTAQKVQALFGAEHPIFGPAGYHRTVTPEQAFALGQKHAEKLA